tara:strand:- start:1893 stop:3950 length:2058 start_codon:yes stop_codon:yes gene_type:complete
MPKRIPRPLVPAAALLLVGASCHKSSSSAPPPIVITNNLTASAVEVATAQPRVGYPLEVVTTIEALEDTVDVSVSYYALNGDDVANELDEVRQFYLGSVTFPVVRVGTPTYRAELTVPTGVTPPGSYVILCSVDPSDLVEENNEDDNEAELAVATVFAPIADPNVYLQEFVLDRQSIVLDPDVEDVAGQLQGDVQNTDAGGTLTVGLEGSINPVEMEAFVRLRVTRSDLPIGQNTIDLPLYLWDSANDRYIDAFGLNGPVEWLPLGAIAPDRVLESGEAVMVDAQGLTSVHLDLYVPGGLAEIVIDYLKSGGPPVGLPPVPDLPPAAQLALITFLTSGPQPITITVLDFEILADVRAKDPVFVDSNPLDNSAAQPFYVLLPGEESSAPDRPLAFDAGLDSSWDSDRFGIGFDFDAFASVDGRGAIAEVVGSVPAEVFGNTFDFMRFDARAQVVPAIDPNELPPGENSGFSLEIEFASLTLYSYEEPLGYVFTGAPEPFSKEKSFTKQFFVGPVPVVTTGGVMGEIGYELAANLQPTSLACSLTPYATLSATLSGAVGVAGLSGGAGAELILLDERFVGAVNTGISVVDDNTFEGRANMQVRNVLSGPSGRVYLFAEYPGVRWCRRKVLNRRFSYPCGIRTIRKELNLVSWATFQKEDVLFDETLCKRVTLNSGLATFSNACTQLP